MLTANRRQCSRGGPAKIFLVRHGETVFNKTKRISGQMEAELTARGRRQARRLAGVFEAIPLDTILCSTLRRALDTAAPVAAVKGIPIHREPALREVSHGVLEGRYRDHRDPSAQAQWQARHADKLHYRSPGGETLAAMYRRVRAWCDARLPDFSAQSVLIVGHRNTNRILLGLLLDLPETTWITLNVRNRFVYEISGPDTTTVRSLRLDATDAQAAFMPGLIL